VYDSILGVAAGSSPRMRGTLKGSAGNIAQYRFIPAHAGNTLELALSLLQFTVHPRACGEHTSSIFLLYQDK